MRVVVLGLGAAWMAAAQGSWWPETTPAAAGFDAAKLEAMRDNLARHGTSAVLIVRDGHKVFEWYAEGWSAARPHGTASMAKALVGGVSLVVAMNDGRIRPTDHASRFIPGWSGDPLKSKILIRQLATHSSGIQDASHTEPGWMDRFWKRTPIRSRSRCAKRRCCLSPARAITTAIRGWRRWRTSSPPAFAERYKRTSRACCASA
jgi:CubicO group peptidase (beta-lactamase class C family)